MKASALTGIALDWAVTTIENPEALRFGVDDWRQQRRATVVRGEYLHRYHQSWAQAGPIIERERIGVKYTGTAMEFVAWINGELSTVHDQYGPTPLIAAMRCYVASKLGDDITLPDELN